MQFIDLYNYCLAEIRKNERDKKRPLVTFDAAKSKVLSEVAWIGGINAYPVDSKIGDPFGHFEVFCERGDRWEENDTWVVLISFNDENLTLCQQRFVCFKEIMHVFDGPESETNNQEKFTTLLSDIENEPLEPSKGYLTEKNAQWMALLAMCPKPYRDAAVDRLNNYDATPYEIALEFRIPESVISALRSNGYEQAYRQFIEAEQNA